MNVYTVHEPPRRKGDALDHAARFVFVRDGFSWGAFLFGPIWMLWHRLFIVLFAYIVVVAAAAFGLSKIAIPQGTGTAIALLFAVFVGLEGTSLRRWTLRRNGWNDLGVVTADDLVTAERRFFDKWVVPGARKNAPVSAAALPPATKQSPDVIGLFPEPDPRP